MFSLSTGIRFQPMRSLKWVVLPLVSALTLATAHWCMAQDNDKPPAAQPAGKANKYHKPEDDSRPDAVPEFKLDRVLKTVPVAHDQVRFNYQMIDASLLPRDKQGIWVLDFAFKPLRIKTIDAPGRRRQIHYLYYKVVNRTGQARMFVPQFFMVNEKQQKFEDEVIPEAVPLIKIREDATVPVHGAVDIVGMIPPSTKPNIDEAVYGVACWDKWDARSDRFSIYVRGLSDGYVEVPSESGGKPVVKYKTLRIDFIRRGDEHNLSEREIEFADPVYQWVYW